MTPLRLVTAALLVSPLIALTACGGAGTAEETWVTPTAVESTLGLPVVAPVTVTPAGTAAPSPSPSKSVKPSRTPSKSPSATRTSAKPVVSDRKLCASVISAKEDLAGTLLGNMDDDGDVPAGIAGPAFKKFARALSSAAGTGGTTKVTSAVRRLAAAVSKVAAAKDPMAASEGSAPSAADDRLDAACAAAGATGY
ncbi:hypothetical protein [Actinoplanes cyaneus]|uniref:hypothetical protein n=1 Tax=Actinoplanes cyaneus TaxID=52696 RepID=UPI0019426FB8|nr:hypothetical protein [Actinoplanes cyaneus]